MSVPVALSKGPSLLKEISDFVANSTVYLDPNEKTLHVLRWQREVEAVMRIDSISGSLLYSKIAEAHGDIDGVEKWCNNARLLNSNEFAEHLIVAYSNLGYASRGLKVFRDYVDISRGNIGSTIRLTSGVGAFQEMVRLLDHVKRGSIDVHESGNLPEIEEIARLMSSLGMSDDSCASVIDVAGEILRKHRLLWLGSKPNFIVDSTSQSVLMRFDVDASYSAASAMSNEAIDLLIARNLDSCPFMIDFVGTKS